MKKFDVLLIKFTDLCIEAQKEGYSHAEIYGVIAATQMLSAQMLSSQINRNLAKANEPKDNGDDLCKCGHKRDHHHLTDPHGEEQCEYCDCIFFEK